MGLSDWIHSQTMRTQILLSVGIIATITIAVIFAVAVGMFDWIGKDSKNLVTTTLESQAKDFLLQSSLGTADSIDKKFAHMEEIVSMMTISLQYLFGTQQLPYAPVPSYLWWNDSTLPSDVEYSSRFDSLVSHCCSTVYVTGGTYDNYSISLEDPNMVDAITRSAHMDLFYPGLVDANIDIGQLEIGFTNVPLLRRYPATSIFRSRDYDPKQRPWYSQAITAGQSLAYGDPYVNTETGAWTIAISQTIVVNSFTQLGVTALEMRTNTLQADILSQKLYDSGYALLIQQDGLVVAGRVFNAGLNDTVYLNQLSDSLSLSDLQPIGVAQVRSMTIGGQAMLVSQSGLIRNRYVVVHIAPRDEILAPVTLITSKINHNNKSLLATTAAIGVGTLVFVILLSSIITSRVVKPVGTISNVALKIVHNTTKANIMENVAYSNVEYQDDEIGDLARAFSAMIEKLSGKQAVKRHSIPIDHKTVEMREL